MSSIYWCEFPTEVEWEKLGSWLKKDIIVYLPCKTLEEYNDWKRKLESISKFFIVRVWPILEFSKGYWFSGFCTKESIDKLDQFKGIPMKIDIEPPKPEGKYNFWMAVKWLVFNLFKEAKNKDYLQEKIKELSKEEDIIVSCFPLPQFLIRRWGWIKTKDSSYNFMYYTTFLLPGIREIYSNLYYRFFVNKHKDSFFAIGLIGTGIFGNEPKYKNLSHMKKDIAFLKSLGVKNIAYFRIGSLVERGKDWFEATR